MSNAFFDFSALKKKYRAAGSKALKKTGVHHLSQSSCGTLRECTQQFYYKSELRAAKPELSLGNIGHALVERVCGLLTPAVDKYFGGEITSEELCTVFPEFRDAVLDKLDISEEFMKCAAEEFDNLINSSVEMLFQGGPTDFRNKLMSLSETMSKSITRELLARILEHPPVACEIPVAYFPKGLTIPYMGYIDLLCITPSGMHISDLKFTFSNNQYVWNDPKTVFQLWLYSVSLLQMGIVDKMPGVSISRVTVDGPKRKVIPSMFKVTLERKSPPPLRENARTFHAILHGTEHMITSGIEIFANSKYGCGSCDYKDRCQHVESFGWIDLDKKDEG